MASQEQKARDSETLGEALLEKPPAPAAFDEAATRQRVSDWAAANRRPPGEPLLEFELLNSHAITPDEAVPQAELTRRQQVAHYSYSFRLLFNEKEVCRSNSKCVRRADIRTSNSSLTTVQCRCNAQM